MTNEIDSLVHFQVPKDDPNDPDLDIEYDVYESLLDGKTKYVLKYFHLVLHMDVVIDFNMNFEDLRW